MTGRSAAEEGVFPIRPFPIGWYQIAYSDEIQVGEVKPLRYFGTDLACYRTESGELRLVDAFCPHLGAHLGYGGRVEGECLVCPFHGWTYGGDGRNVAIPYSNRANASASLSCWHVEEADGLAMAWFHPRREAPSWSVGPIPELTDPAFARPERTELEIHVHPQEVFENAVDLAHFLSIHGAARMPEVEVLIDGPQLRSVTTNQALKGSKGYFEGGVESQLWGLGVDVARVTGLVDTVAVLTLTPIEDGTVAARFTVTARTATEADNSDPERAARLAARAQSRVIEEFEADLMIWEHKRYEPSPRLAPQEKLITRFRKWAQQFYDWENEEGDL